MSLQTAALCFIVCHGGPADHIATYAQTLKEQGINIRIYAVGDAAIKKFQERKIEIDTTFSLKRPNEVDELSKVVAKTFSVVVTDVGDPYDIKLQQSLADHAPKVSRWAYYDNFDPFVPGGYSKTAAQVMLAAEGILFANQKFETTPVCNGDEKEIDFGNRVRIGIGYYPLDKAEAIIKRRVEERAMLRSKILSESKIEEVGQKILVYYGGNNDEYFSNAFPAFISLLEEAAQDKDLSNYVIMLQKHPGASKESKDTQLVLNQIEKFKDNKKTPKLIFSPLSSSDDAQVGSDLGCYYQTSMGLQMVWAGIPLFQIGHRTHKDVLINNELCPSVLEASQLIDVLNNPEKITPKIDSKDDLREKLGIRKDKDWQDILLKAFSSAKR